MKEERVFFQSEGEKISGVLHLPDKTNAPCVIASHGLLSSKDSEKFVALGERFSQEGIALLRFDFRGCGESEGRMEQSTVSGRIADLHAAVDFVRTRKSLKRRLGLLGSSLGGYVSLIKASMDREIRAVAVWSTPFRLDGMQSRREEEEMRVLGDPFFEDLPKHELLPCLSKVSSCLVIHGQKDELVPVDHAWAIFEALGTPKEIRVIDGADHRLTDPAHRQRAMDLTVDWFKKFI